MGSISPTSMCDCDGSHTLLPYDLTSRSLFPRVGTNRQPIRLGGTGIRDCMAFRPPRSEASQQGRAVNMRELVTPPPAWHCSLCGGDLRLSRIAPDFSGFGYENDILVCTKCGHEQSYRMMRDPYLPRSSRVHK
jgi:hypothetical protein